MLYVLIMYFWGNPSKARSKVREAEACEIKRNPANSCSYGLSWEPYLRLICLILSSW